MPARLNDPKALNQVAAHGHQTPSYGGKVTLFPASRINRDSGMDRRLRWGGFARGGLQVGPLAIEIRERYFIARFGHCSW